eukprot:356002-Chlamydomonas_euryale.AAC.1
MPAWGRLHGHVCMSNSVSMRETHLHDCHATPALPCLAPPPLCSIDVPRVPPRALCPFDTPTSSVCPVPAASFSQDRVHDAL